MVTAESENAAVASQASEESPADAAMIVKIPWKRKWLVLSMALLSTSLGVFYALKQPKIYEAKATIQIEPRAPNVLGRSQQNNEVVDMGAGAFWSNREYFETQYRIIESRDLAEVVVKKLGLNRNPVFFGAPPNATISQSTINAAIVLQGCIKVEPVKDTRLVNLRLRHTDPELAELLVNTIAESYIARNLERTSISTEGALGWLTEQLSKLRETLDRAEQNLYEFKKERNVLSVALEDRQTLISQELTTFSNTLTRVKTERLEVESQIGALSDALKSAGAGDLTWGKSVTNDPLLEDLKAQYSKGLIQLSSFHTRYGPDHPMVRNAEAQLAEIRQRVKDQLKSVLAGIEIDHQAKLKMEKGLKVMIDELHHRGAEMSLLQIDYGKLAREREQSSKLFDMVLGRTKETDLVRYLHFNNISMLDAALMPSGPVSPRVSVIVTAAMILGFAIGVALTFLIEVLDFTVRSYEDAQREAGAPLLGVLAGRDTLLAKAGGRYGGKYGSSSSEADQIKELDDRGFDLIAASHPHSVISEAARAIRTNLLFMSADSNIRRLLVTSPGPSEGKTFVATTLAIVIAQSGKSVLLVDTDLRRPRLHKLFPRSSGSGGVTDALAGQAAPADIVVSTSVPNLSVAFAGPIPPNPAELLHTSRFAELVDTFNGMFDLVVFDSPPVGVVTDAAVLSQIVDGCVIVARHGRTHKASLRHVAKQLRRIGSTVFGVVLNDADFSKGSYYRYDYYRTYGYQYKSDYRSAAASSS